MPDAFKIARIKLIPKKGDCSKIKNWRPISLLSNFYKIISRLINNRLKKIANRVLSRSQKGFNQSRYIHEVLINSCETMDHCKKNGIKAAMVSVDISKAFDSVSHSYMEKVYDFYGFGPQIKFWLKTIGTGRSAQIIFEHNALSDPFNLGRGHAQGDSPSPFLYNMATQICIWKIELDPLVKSVYSQLNYLHQPISRTEVFNNENCRQTDKNESFADDANNFVLLEYESLLALKNILESFSKISGLVCNVEKTWVLRVGNVAGPVDPRILGLGFTFVDSITILGFRISNRDTLIIDNFEPIIEKLLGIVRYWERFYLTLPGRIAIYKTLLMPQLNYIAAILTPTTEITERISAIFERFVSNGINISKKRLYLSTGEGGLGMFKLENFIAALQSIWIKRCIQSINDNWKFDLSRGTDGRILFLYQYPMLYDTLGTVLRYIVDSYNLFCYKYTTFDNNYLKMPIYLNTEFGYGRNRIHKLNDEFFGLHMINNYKASVIGLTWEKCTVYGEFTQFDNFYHQTGIPVTQNQYESLKKSYEIVKKRLHEEGKSSLDLEEYMNTFKKGS